MTSPASSALHAVARLAGIQINWHDVTGQAHTVDDQVLCRVLESLDFPVRTRNDIKESLHRLTQEETACPPLLTATLDRPVVLPNCLTAGHWRLDLENGGTLTGTVAVGPDGTLSLPPVGHTGYHRLSMGAHSATLAIAPNRCLSIEARCRTQPARTWGVSAQLYGLRCEQRGLAGIGDFSALEALARSAALAGSDAVAISPVHAMFTANPHHYSPYAPSSRVWLNASYVDPYQTFSASGVRRVIGELGLEHEFAALEESQLVDGPRAVSARIAVLRRLFDEFVAAAPEPLTTAFIRFRQDGGQALEQHATFEALHAHFAAQGLTDWRQWPDDMRTPDANAVAQFSQTFSRDVDFHVFLQWLAARGLQQAQDAATRAGMKLGLLTDLAVGADPAGSQAWSQQSDVLANLSPGAPPDLYNPLGQSCGLTAFSPQALRKHGFQAFIAVLRSALRYAGGVRIDHALGLQRMWLVPSGADPRHGAYVHYPFDDMLRLIALESERHSAIVLGENLGTVPPDFNDRMHTHGIYGMSVLWFERMNTGEQPAPFLPAPEWNPANIALTSTHDLPTVNGWWAERDLDWRARLGLLGEVTEATARAERRMERQLLWQAVRTSDEPTEPPTDPPIERIIEHLGSTPAPLVILPLEDIAGMDEQPNLPGTIDTHPNWRRRLPVTVEQLLHAAPGNARVHRLAQTRRNLVLGAKATSSPSHRPESS